MKKRVVEKLNVLLMLAYQIVEDETCSSCGVPYWYGKSTVNHVAFKIEQSTCHSCAELEREREADSKNKKKEHGVTKFVVPYGEADLELPTREESYRKMR